MPTIGISIGTRRNGIAVIKNRKLRTAQVHTLNERWSKHKLAAFISLYDRYIQQYNVSVVVVKSPKSSHFTLAIKELLKALDSYAKKQGCRIKYTTITQISKSSKQSPEYATNAICNNSL